MIHAVLLVLVGALFRKLGIRDLTPQEEQALPSYYVKAEHIQRWVFGVVVGVGLAMAALLAFLLDGVHLRMPQIDWQQVIGLLIVVLLVLFVSRRKFRHWTLNIVAITFGAGSILLSLYMVGASYWPTGH